MIGESRIGAALLRRVFAGSQQRAKTPAWRALPNDP